MRHYCTVFDKNYLAKGLTMYESLKRHSSEAFLIHVLTLDNQAENVLWEIAQQETDNLVLSTLTFFESNREYLKPIRSQRTWQEYCWTLASQWIESRMSAWESEITYLDADLFFFSDPKVVHDEIGDRSIGVIPHRLIPSKRHLEVNGKFNVGWVTFKNTEAGRACLSRWAAQVRERCDASTCGDQKYLDEWPELYGDEVCVIQNIGANLAPWNVSNYRLTEGLSGPLVYGDPVVFYHFHEYEHGKRLTNYELRPEDIELIYKPYIAAIDAATEKINAVCA